nr:hypothetical protein [uncultured Fluviicola sp.]
MFKGRFISIVYSVTILVFGAMAWFGQSEGLNIVFDDTYVVLPKSVFWLVLAGLFLLFAGIALCFELFRKPMNKYLFATHYLLTVASLVIIYLSTRQQEVMPATTPAYSVMDDVQNQQDEAIDWIIYAIYTLVGAQVIFVLNIVVSLIKSRKQPSGDLK